MNLPDNPSDEAIAELNQRQLFIRDAMPDAWLDYAEELGEAAEALWNVHAEAFQATAETTLTGESILRRVCQHSRSYILLIGLAFENVLKGLLVADDPSQITDGHVKTLKSHNLQALAARLPWLSLTQEEQRVLAICQDAIPYWGRYPVPLTYQGLQADQAADQQFRDVAQALHFRLCNDLHQRVKDGWDSGAGPKVLVRRAVRYGDEISSTEEFPVPEPHDQTQ